MNNDIPLCPTCGTETESELCTTCHGEGYADEFHDCGEDSCACLYPEPGVCSDCGGQGYFWVCPDVEAHSQIRKVLNEATDTA